MHDRKKRGCYIHTSIKECVDPRRTMNIQKESESDELRFYLYIFIKIQERFISLNFQKYKHAPMKICQV
jgi:hypothetical protein